MYTIAKALVAGLATFGVVQAYPQANGYATSGSPTATAAAPSSTENPDQLFLDLFKAPTAIKRFQRLLTDAGESLKPAEILKKYTVFDFNNAQPNAGAKGGATKSANVETFPILTDLGISTTVGFLDACGMNTPHVHPRATEFLTVTQGTVNFGYIVENGLIKAGNNGEIAGQLTQFQGTVFPIGSIHYQFNPNCEKAVFVATLNHEDPGTSQLAQNFFGLNVDVVDATIGFPGTLDGKDINAFRKNIPANIALSVDSCLQKCGLQTR
ncbi:spherulin-1B precursor [Massariosphaeria phaeospora]|uniref:Spherulin-1B n=1 Tax=Massariosphaeria phaeospora TaxID=100035 RepID=A0A7C8IFT9_9PLEO|nr:spherulin-1B precursor [Massariosphaeria phaeospora]